MFCKNIDVKQDKENVALARWKCGVEGSGFVFFLK